jgi:hypothetical protein
LTQKFGEPTTLETVEMQNAFGARFKKIKAVWNTEYYVEYNGFKDKLEEGGVFIQSAAERERDLERVNSYRAAHPPKTGL